MSTLYTVRVNDETYEALVDDPHAPVCSVCGHGLCPCCVEVGHTSCDMIVHYEEGKPEPCVCFDTDGCRVDASKVATFRAEVRRRRELACFGGSGALFSFEESQTA